MNYLFYLGHPAHYHNIKNVARQLSNQGHNILLVARDKDVLIDLLSRSKFNTIYLKNKKKSNSLFSLILFILQREFMMAKICLKFKPNILIGTDLVITHIGKLYGVPSIIINEDDANVVPFLVKFGYKFATGILAPKCCSVGNYKQKKIGYEGYQELAYLHPNYFTPNRTKIAHLFKNEKPYFLLRFAQLDAHHDKGRTGINHKIALQLIDILKPKGNIYITSERPLEKDLEKYRIAIHPSDMHHALAYADMYIGDSQTMTAEAAILGTPSIRFNDFVGEINYLESLESYGLTKGFKTVDKDNLLLTVKKWISTPNLKENHLVKKHEMLSNSVDVTQFWHWFFANYPDSLTTCRNNPNFSNKFKKKT